MIIYVPKIFALSIIYLRYIHIFGILEVQVFIYEAIKFYLITPIICYKLIIIASHIRLDHFMAS